MNSIEESGKRYKEQLSEIETILEKFALENEWIMRHYGRRPNVGIYGKVSELDGSIKIESEENSWNVLPNEI